MIGTIRKHSSWLWFVIIALTIVSFLWWGAAPATRNSRGRGAGGSYGTLYGHEITPESYETARRSVALSYWQQTGEFPDKSPNIDRQQLEQQIYIRLLLEQKARDMGVQIPQSAEIAAANEMLRSIGRGQPVPMDAFYQKVLQPEGLSVADFERFIRSFLTIQQLVQTVGLPGALVTPADAEKLYDRENQEVSAQAVFFNATNYLAQVSVTPAAINDFYAKNMAAYREPDRVQVSYVQFDLTNYFGVVEQKFGKTNLDAQAENLYRERGSELAPEAKTAPEAKAKIRGLLLKEHAFENAVEDAKGFATALYAVEPVKGENLAAVAKQKNLKVHSTAPFSANLGPEDFSAPQSFTKAAFQLNAEMPFSEVIAGPDAVYILSLDKLVPSSIPPLDQIRSRVTQDFQEHSAIALAQAAGTNFYYSVSVQLAAGKSFAQSAVAAGHAPLPLVPFSLNSSEVPELGNRADLGQLKQAAFTTSPGHASRFMETGDGGFVLFVNSLEPVDATKKKNELPQFISQVRRARESEAFNLWLNSEANRELQNTAFFEEQKKKAAAPNGL